MNIKHIKNKNGYWETKLKENTSEIYKLRIYRNLEYSYYGCNPTVRDTFEDHLSAEDLFANPEGQEDVQCGYGKG